MARDAAPPTDASVDFTPSTTTTDGFVGVHRHPRRTGAGTNSEPGHLEARTDLDSGAMTVDATKIARLPDRPRGCGISVCAHEPAICCSASLTSRHRQLVGGIGNWP
jgi:hypothetical protein